jgi:zinc protease
MKRIVLPAMLAVLTWQPTIAAETPPPPGQPRDFTLPGSETLELDNGLRITFIDYGIVPKVTVLAVVRSGNIDDGKSTWLADLTTEMLKEGAGGLSSGDIARRSAEMGGELFVGARGEQILVGVSVLSEYASDAAALVAKVLREPALPEDQLPRIVANLQRSVAVAASDPGSMAAQALYEMLYPGHPFAQLLPTQEQLASYTLEDVRRFYRDNFGARRTHVYVAGRYDRAALEAALKQAFADWQAGAAATENPPKAGTALQVRLIDRPGAPQSVIKLAVAAPDPTQPDYLAFEVMNSLLGGPFISRIMANLREDKGYAYSPGTSLSVNRHAGLWTFDGEITTVDTAAALAEVYGEVERMKSAAPPASELSAIKNYRTGLFVIGNSSANGVLGQLAFADLHGLPDAYLTTWVARVNALTPEQVRDAAAHWLDLSQATLVIVGDLSAIETAVRALPQLQGATYR